MNEFNELGYPGRIIRDPWYVVDFRTERWGFSHGCTSEYVLNGICHDLGVTIGQFDAWCEKYAAEVVRVRSFPLDAPGAVSRQCSIGELHRLVKEMYAAIAKKRAP